MSAKTVLILCAQALIFKVISGQCINAAYGPSIAPIAAWTGCGAAYTPAAYTSYPASNYNSFGVSSASPLSPAGVSVLSENAIEGALAVAGTLPFLGTVALEGIAPTTGAGVVNYGCGNANVGILNEGIAAAAIAPANVFGLTPNVYSGYGLAGPGYLGYAPCGVY